jgi:hypothetical protein
MLHAIGIGLAFNDAAGDSRVAPFYGVEGCLELLTCEFPHSLHKLFQPVKLLIERLHDMIGHGCLTPPCNRATRHGMRPLLLVS